MAAADLYTSTLAPNVPSRFKSDLEPDDMNSFFDFNQADSYPSPAKPALPTGVEAPTPRSASTVTVTDDQTFAAPSHEYERYQQQTGLPVGTVASFDALNRSFQALKQPQQHNDADLSDDNISLDTQNYSWATGLDMDMDMQDVVNGNNTASTAAPAPVAQPSRSSFQHSNQDDQSAQRIYPGMHSQAARMDYRVNNAAVARAHKQYQHQARKDTARPQDRRYSQQNQIVSQPILPQVSNGHMNIPMGPQPPLQVAPAQLYQPQQFPAQNYQSQQQRRGSLPQQQQPASGPSPARSRASSNMNDEFTQQTIKNVLQKIRQDSSVAAQVDNDDGLPHLAKLRKDEEEMDEDEKLLASEEGKKLSSKERRQLRNKVSARAFRSRRKDYIQQLESVVRDSNDRVKCAEAENRQLLGLINMLLGQPAMRQTLDALSRDQNLLRQATTSAQPQQQRRMSQNISLQVPGSDSASTNTSQSPMVNPRNTRQSVGEGLDLSGLNLDNASQWDAPSGHSDGGFDFNQPNIFAVYELPQGPSLDEIKPDVLSGKRSETSLLINDAEDQEEVKSDMPIIDKIPKLQADVAAPERSPYVNEAPEQSSIDEEELAKDPLCALYVNSPKLNTTAQEPAPVTTQKFELMITPTESSILTAEERLRRMTKTLDQSLERLESLI